VLARLPGKCAEKVFVARWILAAVRGDGEA
jgi:hypothetical protein